MTIFSPQINPDRCIGCEACVTSCPTDALSQRHQKAFLARPDACTYCLLCEEVCPVGAIELPLLVIRMNEG